MVVLVEFIKLDDVNEFLSIGGIGGVAARFQSPGPSPVVGTVEPEELGIALVAREEAAVILIALFGVVVGTETLTDVVVVLAHCASRPSVAFNAEVVVALRCERTESCTALKGTLCQRNACRDTVAKHLFDGQILVLVEILLISLVPPHLPLQRQHDKETHYGGKELISDAHNRKNDY